jgi:hypothetical protein
MPVPDFSPGEVLTAAAMDSIGLWLVKTVTVGSGVSSVPVTSCFSADYDNYRIVISGIDCSINSNGYYLTLSGSAGATYAFAVKWVDYGTGVIAGTQNAGSVQGFFVSLTGALDSTNASIDMYNPFKTVRTNYVSTASTDLFQTYAGGQDLNAASSTGCTLLAPVGQTFTGGTIRVYGYRN